MTIQTTILLHFNSVQKTKLVLNKESQYRWELYMDKVKENDGNHYFA